jgi:hypothetical protein
MRPFLRQSKEQTAPPDELIQGADERGQRLELYHPVGLARRAMVLPLVFLSLCFGLTLDNPSRARADSTDEVALKGVLTDLEGTPLAGGSVTLTSPQLMGMQTAITDANGRFHFVRLPPMEKWLLKGEAPGYASTRVEGSSPLAGRTTVVNLKLRPLEWERARIRPVRWLYQRLFARGL